MFKNPQTMKANAQTAIELAVFGAILIFVVGGIIQTTIGYNYQQNQSLKAFRMAMLESYNGSVAGVASRNTASVVIVEDRLVASSGKFASVDRTPLMFVAAATHSRNLFMPFDSGETFNIPVQDVYVNGKHFPFYVAGLKTVSVSGPIYSKVPNHPAIPEWNPGCDPCFDLDRDGTVDVPAGERANFAWQWHQINLSDVDLEKNANSVADVDGDLKEERILSINGNSVEVVDFQDGDIDVTLDDSDRKPPSGLTLDISVFTFTKEGQVLEIDEGELFAPGRQYVRQAQRSDQVDVIQRVFQLANDTGHFCPGGAPQAPVEACDNCFSSANIARTCFQPGMLGVDPPRYPMIFIRSRILNKGGRKWVTDITDDPYVNLNPDIAN